MKVIVTISILFLIHSNLLIAQELNDSITIFFDSKTYDNDVIERCKNWSWIINGKSTKITSSRDRFPIQNSGLDTIVFNRPGYHLRDTVVTKFKEHNEYIINYNQCCHSFDIYLLKTHQDYLNLYKTESWAFADSIENYNESGIVIFLIKNFNDTNMVVGSYGDIFSTYTGGVILQNNIIATKKNPFKTGYSGNVYSIIMGSIELVDRDSLEENWDEKEYHVYLNHHLDQAGRFLKEFVNLKCRFFNKEKIFVGYDFKTGKSEIKID